MPIDVLTTERMDSDQMRRSTPPAGGVIGRVRDWMGSQAAVGLHGVYQRARIVGSLVAATSLAGLALALSWPPGALVAALVTGVTAHALLVSRRADEAAFVSLVVDMSVLAAGLLLARPPFLIVLPPLAYVIVVAPLLLQGYRAALVVTYAIVTSGAALVVIDDAGMPAWSLTETIMFVVVAAACTTPAMYRILRKAGREVARSRELSQVLQQQEEEYRSLVEHIPVGMYRTTPDGQILAANPALAELLGYTSPEELMNAGVAPAFSTSAERRRWQEAVERDGTLADWELPLLRRDGDQIWVRDTARAVRERDGTIRCYEGALEDVTDRKQAEGALRESEERYRRLVETSPLGIAVYCDDSIAYANSATACLLGAESVDEVVGTALGSLVHPDDPTLAERILTLQDERNDELPSPHEQRLVRFDGQIIDVEVTSIPTSYRGKKAAQIVLHDVSDYKRAQAQVRARSDELEKLFGLTSAINAGQSVTEILDGLFESFRGLLPYDRIEYADVKDEGRAISTRWVQADYDDLVLEEGHLYRREQEGAAGSQMRPRIDNDLVAYAESRGPGNPARLLVAEGLRSSLSCPLVLRETVVGYLFFASRSPDAYSSEHAALMHRLADQIAVALEQSRLRDELIIRNESLENLNQSRTQFLANVSHELRTPLTAVVGLASEMRDRLDHIAADEIEDFAHLIATSSSEVAGIVEDLLAIARAEQGQLTVIPESIDLHEIARTAVDTWDPKESTSIQVSGERSKAWADPLRVRQIVRNLCSNARHYGGDTIEIRVLATRSEAVLVVADNGTGIPEPERDAIFEAYVGAGDRTRSSVGLGLTVSRHLAQAMGGDLTYKYQDCQSQFHLSLPVMETPPTTARPPA